MFARTRIARAILSASAVTFLVSGCAASLDESRHDDIKAEIEQRQDDIQRQVDVTQSSSIEELDSFYADTRHTKREGGEWLEDIPFSLDMNENRGGISLRQLMRMLGNAGVNITTQLDIDNFYYSGTDINDANARSALKLILGAMGVDYTYDDESKSVEITTMPRETYSLSLNNREASYSSSGTSGISDDQGSSGGSDDDDDEDSTPELEISTNNNFWESLENELNSRCTMLVPQYGDPVSMPVQASSEDSDEALVGALQGSLAEARFSGDRRITTENVCIHSVNANTGTITVQGPRWVQSDLDEYFSRLNEMLNTRITMQAKIILFRNTRESSAGVDLSLFSGQLDNMGLAVRNNVMGGVTLGSSGNMADISSSGAIGNAFLGGKLNGAQAFIGWLEEQGSVTIENEPIITTVSGVPTTFKRTSPVVYFRYTQETTANEGGSVSVSINSEEVERSVGSIINVNPTYDIDRRMVRTQIGINQRYLTDYAEDVSFLATGNSIQEIPVRIPLIEEIVLNGEILLRDGETIIVGGQQFSRNTDVERGVQNLREDSLIGGLFGSSNTEMEDVTFFVVLTTAVDEATNEQSNHL